MISEVIILLEKGFFYRLGNQSWPYFGGKLYSIFAKGGEKLDVSSILGENCMILKNFSLRKPPLNLIKKRKKAM
jgi:hypothetical protein